MKNFTTTEAAFYDYLLSRGYAKSTSLDYVRRIRKIGAIDTMVNQNLDPYIADYTTGSHEDFNHQNHNTYSNALKRLQEMQKGTL